MIGPLKLVCRDGVLPLFPSRREISDNTPMNRVYEVYTFDPLHYGGSV